MWNGMTGKLAIRILRWAPSLGVTLALLTVPAVAAALACSQQKFREVPATVCEVTIGSDRLQLFLKDAAGSPFTSFRRLDEALAARGERLAFAMNAGMYREDYSPVGLLVSDGRQLHRLNLASGYGNFYLKPNGVFVLAGSRARIVESSEYRSLQDPAVLATQSGPLLVQDGHINAALNPQGTSRLIRNGVGVISPTRVVFAISEEPVTFYEFALLFRDGLKCADALYLDGNVSSLYVRSLGRDDERVPIGPIIGVTVPASH
jgi:uncharacterized protein YigE (DUF2233 family)